METKKVYVVWDVENDFLFGVYEDSRQAVKEAKDEAFDNNEGALLKYPQADMSPSRGVTGELYAVIEGLDYDELVTYFTIWETEVRA